MVFGEQQWTYAELNARANRLAHHLRTLGVGPEVRVGICVERSLAMVAGLLGILKAGGAYVPLDPAYPPQRLAYLLHDAQVPVLLTQAHLRGRLPEHQAQVVLLDGEEQAWQQGAEHNPQQRRRAGEPGLRHLHLRLHRQAQGRHARAPQRRQLPRLGLRSCSAPEESGQPCCGNLGLLRPVGLRAAGAAVPRRPASCWCPTSLHLPERTAEVARDADQYGRPRLCAELALAGRVPLQACGR